MFRSAHRRALRRLLGFGALSIALAWVCGCTKPEATGSEAANATHSEAAHPATDDSEGGVSLTADQIQKMGIAVAAATPLTHAAETAGFGLVSAHESIAQAVNELVTAAAVERQSRAALARVHQLAGGAGAMPADVQEAAERQAAVDQAALLLAKQRLTASFGQNPPWKDDANSAVLRALAQGETKLVRVTFPLGALSTEKPMRLQMAHLNAANSARSWTSTTIWNAPSDASVPGRSFFALLDHSDAGEGERLLAWAPTGSPESGALVSAASVLVSEGKYWCYVERRAGFFVRTELDAGAPVADGYFVKREVAPGDKVVTSGAGLLLAHETNPSSAAE